MAATLQVSCVQLHRAKSLEFNLQRTILLIGCAAEAGSRVVLLPFCGNSITDSRKGRPRTDVCGR